jgi:pentatricopeptide repeat protein
MCLIDFFCKQDRFDMAYRVLNQMFVSGFSPSFVTMNDVLRGLIRIEDMRNAFEMHEKMIEHTGIGWLWIDDDTLFSLLQGLADEFTYTSLMNAYLDEGKWDYAEELYAEMEGLEKLLDRNEITHFCSLPRSVIYSVFINGLDNNKARTTEIKKELLMFNYFANLSLNMPILEYHLTLAKNCSHDEFKSLVELVEGICDRGLENAYDYDTILKSDYNKPDGIDDGIVYNLFVIAHCQRNHIDEAYNMYKEMVHYGFACHMFTVFALVELYRYPYRYIPIQTKYKE